MVTIERKADSWRKICLQSISAPALRIFDVGKILPLAGLPGRAAVSRCIEVHAGRGSRFQN
jgi:hypothetical protein